MSKLLQYEQCMVFLSEKKVGHCFSLSKHTTLEVKQHREVFFSVAVVFYYL